MTDKRSDREQRLLEFAKYFKSADVDSCRLVHYCGVDRPNAIDVPLSDVESQVAGCIDEGFTVQWLVDGNRLYLAMQEPDELKGSASLRIHKPMLTLNWG